MDHALFADLESADPLTKPLICSRFRGTSLVHLGERNFESMRMHEITLRQRPVMPPGSMVSGDVHRVPLTKDFAMI